MTESSSQRQAFGAGRATWGALLGLAGHLLAFGAAFVAARLRTPSAGGGLEDLAAAVGALLLGELVVGLVCVVGGVILLAKGRRDLGSGLILGWLVGTIAGWIFIQSA